MPHPLCHEVGGGSSQTRPVTVLIADGKGPQAMIGFKYNTVDYMLSVGVSSLIATKDLPSTTVAIVRGTKVITSVDVADLVSRMINGSYNNNSRQSEKVAMATG